MGKRVVALITADCHLQERAWANRPELHGDAFWSFSWLVGKAIEAHVPVIAAGDLIDKRRNEALIASFVRQQMDRLREADCPFWFVQGQHEFQRPIPWFLAVSDWPFWLQDAPRQAHGIRVGGLDWMPKEELPSALTLTPPFAGCDVAVMHQACEEFMGGLAGCEMSVVSVPGARLLVIGDYHVSKVLSAVNREGMKMLVVSPGSTSVQSIVESAEKKIFWLHDDLSLKEEVIPTRPMLQRDILCEQDMDRFAASARDWILGAQAEALGVPDHLRRPILRVRYSPQACPDAYRRVIAAVVDLAHLWVEEFADLLEEEREADREERHQMAAEGLLGCLDYVADPLDKPQVNGFLRSLLEAPDLGAELSKLRARFGPDRADSKLEVVN